MANLPMRPWPCECLADHADWSQHDVFTAIAALNALDQMGKRAEPIKARLRDRPAGTAPHPRYRDYVGRLLQPLD